MPHLSPIATFGDNWESYSTEDDIKNYLAGTDGQPYPGCLLLPVHHYFNMKAADSKLIIKEAGPSCPCPP